MDLFYNARYLYFDQNILIPPYVPTHISPLLSSSKQNASSLTKLVLSYILFLYTINLSYFSSYLAIPLSVAIHKLLELSLNISFT